MIEDMNCNFCGNVQRAEKLVTMERFILYFGLITFEDREIEEDAECKTKYDG